MPDLARSHTHIIRVQSPSSADTSFYVEELRNILLDVSPLISVQRIRTNEFTQDLGDTLVLILGTPAVIAVVTALNDWLKRRKSVSLDYEVPDQKIKLKNITSKEAVDLIKFLNPQGKDQENQN